MHRPSSRWVKPSSASKKAAVFGGTFDPPHQGHFQVMNTVAESGLVEAVWALPYGAHRSKAMQTSLEDRVIMTHEGVMENCWQAPVWVYPAHQCEELQTCFSTYRCMQYLKRKSPETTFFIVVGSDVAEQMPTWQAFSDLITTFSCIVVQREGHTFMLPKEYTSQYHLMQHPITPNYSSREVQDKIRCNQIKNELPGAVLRYLQQKQLYR